MSTTAIAWLDHWSARNLGYQQLVTVCLLTMLWAAVSFPASAPRVRILKPTIETTLVAILGLIILGAHHHDRWTVWAPIETWRVAACLIGFLGISGMAWWAAVWKDAHPGQELGEYAGLPVLIPMVLICVAIFNPHMYPDDPRPPCSTARTTHCKPISGPAQTWTDGEWKTPHSPAPAPNVSVNGDLR